MEGADAGCGEKKGSPGRRNGFHSGVIGMFRADAGASLRAYQVRIKDEYLDELYLFDAGSVEQEILSRAEEGFLCVVTDRPESIFLKLGAAVKSVTYMGPLVDLPEQLEGHATHWVTQRSPMLREVDGPAWPDNAWQGIRVYAARARDLMISLGLLLVHPLSHAAGHLMKKASRIRAIRAPRASEERP